MSRLIPFTFALLLVTASTPSYARYMDHCRGNTMIKVGELALVNVLWDLSDKFKGRQCIDKSAWRWDWKSTENIPRAYPSVVYGHKPFLRDSTTTSLPLPIGSLKATTVTFELNTEAVGSYATVMTMWINGDRNPQPEEIRTQVDIWFENYDLTMPGTLQRKVTINGLEYEEWRGKVNTWDYIGYKAVKPTTSGSIELAKFLTLIDPKLYVTDVELGNLIANGQGGTQIKRFGIK